MNYYYLIETVEEDIKTKNCSYITKASSYVDLGTQLDQYFGQDDTILEIKITPLTDSPLCQISPSETDYVKTMNSF